MEKSRINIIVGDKQSGKTTFLLDKIVRLKSEGKNVAGIVSRGTFIDNKRNAFYAVDISNSEEKLLMTAEKHKNLEQIGKFYIQKETFEWGKKILRNAVNSNVEIIVLDEIGFSEVVDNKAWADVIPLLVESLKDLYFIVRKEFVDAFILKYKLTNVNIIQNL